MALVRHVAAGGAPSRRLPAHHSEAKVASLAAADG
jgi:hypothetical protein